MPPIPEHTEMDQFVNWDFAAPSTSGASSGFDNLLSHSGPNAAAEPSMDLVLENVDGDDFSFWALEHFESSNLVAADMLAADNMPSWDDPVSAIDTLAFDTPEAPCAHCQAGGYQCKRIQEGRYKGYCTSCIALRCSCSFAACSNPSADSCFPANPWPTLGDHPNPILHEDVPPEKLQNTSSSTSALQAMTLTPSENDLVEPKPPAMPKIGARFSRESVKILKNWLSSHHRHPYPSEEEKDTLQRQTGLNKTQITNWLANARRRGKIQAPRATSPHVKSWSNPIDIPKRKGTPAFENKNPLERWVDSPPENEPASVTAIARAVTASTSGLSSGLNSPHSFNETDDGSGRSLCNQSSTSSLGTSQSSGGSFASAYSHASRGSFGSLGSLGRGRRRRRRRAPPARPDEKTPLHAPLKTFQCTFCTETFRTKHDWQRHEKSLHLSLERWVCAPSGPMAVNPETKVMSCVFCGEANPDEAHIEIHNYSSCQERTLEERTFYRKDHLRQHLKLVHNVKFVSWSMEPWKAATPEIRSRCGFCGIVMDTWTIRVDHLAEHFKTGNTMADWKGDWGFEAPVLDMVENSIPPYLINVERGTPLPFTATQSPPESPRYAYDLIKLELVYFTVNKRDLTGAMPTDDELQLEACRIVFGSEVLSKSGISSTPNWLRDLIMSSGQTVLQAKLEPIKGHTDSRMSLLRINGKDNIFEDDPLEKQLHDFVRARSLLGLTVMDSELQLEACHIIGRMEETSSSPSELVANFLLRLIHRSSDWLAGFRQRTNLPRSDDVANSSEIYTTPNPTGANIYNYSRLESELAEYARNQTAMGRLPSDPELRKQARVIVYDCNDTWNQTAADNLEWLSAFKQRHLPGSPENSSSSGSGTSPMTLESLEARMSRPCGSGNSFMSALPGGGLGNPRGGRDQIKAGPFFLNDANCYRRLARELGRFVASTMSSNNPNRHVPSDEELQHQSRWILYDDDDPWNQTAADNAEWLRRFKRDVGILPPDDGPGLPMGVQWNLAQGGSGFAPPYVFPKAGAMGPLQEVAGQGDSKNVVQVSVREGARFFETEPSIANMYLKTFTSRYEAPAVVFCSRELENGLLSFVEAAVRGTGQVPPDDAIRAEARRMLGKGEEGKTPADDEVLLGKFKEMAREKLGLALGGTGGQVAAQGSAQSQQMGVPDGLGNMNISELPDMDISDTELQDIIHDISFGMEADGGVLL
ncbi:C2H2 type zinc finger domain-containing protein [Pleurostoma richardsiae]|uniref:C2H2 type zinc finger domain-containing protein n=1 Tax=Pleurostoma richardsiae TaxID=41990 RepID=A0AA38R8C3_9PEZI|nr:C2H2 type zinc finger domain-containing protein [Pleurostoma richardsiae]